MPSPPASLTTLLAELAASGIDFILVGGLAAVAQGAPVTLDLDGHPVSVLSLEMLAGYRLLGAVFLIGDLS